MIDMRKLDYHEVVYDSQGRDFLKPKPLPAGYAEASPVSQRAYTHNVQREYEEVVKVVQNASLPARPANWDKASAVEKRTWQLQAQRALAEGKF